MENNNNNDNDNNDAKVVPLERESSNIEIVPFAVRLNESVLQGLDDFDNDNDATTATAPPVSKNSLLRMSDHGIVGTVTFLGKSSAMVWMSWGKLSTSTTTAVVMGRGVPPTIGQMVAAFPRSQYQGAFSSSNSGGLTTQLLGGDCQDNQHLVHQMASRLTQQTGQPVLVSSALFANDDNDNVPEWMTGHDRFQTTMRAATVAERHVCHMIKNHH